MPLDSQRRGERTEDQEIFEEIMAQNSSSLVKSTKLQIQEAEQTQNKINPKKPIHIYIIIKFLKTKLEILEINERKMT